MRYKLSFRIQREYDRFQDFAHEVGITRQHLCNVLQGTYNGGPKFWEKVQKRFNIPDEEMESYRKNEKEDKEEDNEEF